MDEQIKDEDLEKSYWFLKHFEWLRTIGLDVGYGIDIVIGLIVLVFGIFLGVDYYGSRNFVSQISASLVHESPTQLARDIEISNVGIISSNTQSSDAYALIVNQNAGWRANGTFVFRVAGKEYPVKFVLYPSQSRYVVRPGIRDGAGVSVETTLKDVSWHRILPRDSDYLEAFSQIHTSDAVFSDTQSLGIEAPRVGFTIKNDSAYSLWDIEIPIVVLSGSSVVAVHDIPVRQLKSAASQHIEVQWTSSFDIPSGATVSMDPSIDMFDSSSISQE